MNSYKIIFLTLLTLELNAQTGYKSCQYCIFRGKYVCSQNGITYPGPCFARCADDRKFVDGKCKGACDCPETYQPVCGMNGQTYNNECQATCQGTTVDTSISGACKCNCPSTRSPVCGNDQVTYLNTCFASCAGMGVLYLRPCEEFPQIRQYPERTVTPTQITDPFLLNDLGSYLGTLTSDQLQALLKALKN